MAHDVSFKLGISLGEVSDMSTGVPSEPPPLADAFTWFVTMQDHRVGVHALYEGKVQVIGRCHWGFLGLADRWSIVEGFPNDHQWRMVKTAIERVNGGGFLDGRRLRIITPPVWYRRPITLVVLGAAVAVGMLAFLSSIPDEHAEPNPTEPAPVAAPAPPPPPAPAPEPIAIRVAKAPTLVDAIALAKPELADGAEHGGVWLVTRYASTKLAWNDVAGADDTTVPLVLKDSERERGKRLCTSGKIVDIERRDVDQRPVHVGALHTTDGDDVRFIAVGSTGMLVKRSAATLCGVATGKDGKAAVVVGMFDLPENRAPMVER